ncbi:polysaccharide pyruvyl transferase family protein [Serratia fonticola]|uniref:polysaccharide pyruvyl transferase family protein n=1 Tax=Serratia fonticola TaxID=47917 RepID=UPI001647095F|nr:polysaccharide pyruvyl transferase family protein [Serratia fonticola]MBC3252014.1 polysaccharide pyruvyl transferase family protein [Serratia fonticola]
MSTFDFIKLNDVAESRIFIVGSANGSGNLGDEGMFESLAAFVDIQYPEIKISTDAIALDYEPPTKNVDRIIPFYGSVGSSKVRRIIELWCLKNLPKLGLALVRVSKDKSDLYSYYLQLKESDTLIFSGAGAINSVFRGYGIYGWASIAYLSKALGVKYYLTGHGIGPFTSDFDQRTALDFIKNAEKVKVRDKISENFLIKNNVRNCFSDMDDATFIPKLSEDATRVAFERLNITAKKYYVVSLHEWKKGNENEKFVGNVVKLVQEMINHELIVVLLGNKTKGKMNDIPYLKAIKRKYFSENDSVKVVDFKYNALFSKTLVSNSLCLFTTRYHPAIFTYEDKVPVVCFAFDNYYYQKFSGALMYREDKENIKLINISDIENSLSDIKNKFIVQSCNGNIC